MVDLTTKELWQAYEQARGRCSKLERKLTRQRDLNAVAESEDGERAAQHLAEELVQWRVIRDKFEASWRAANGT